MIAACSICLDSFSSRGNISSTPCGHVFHTRCISKWLENGNDKCSECRKSCTENQIIKLYFSENESDMDLINELQEENLRLQEEANILKSLELKETQRCLESKSKELALNQKCLKLQEENSVLSKHLNDLQRNKVNIETNLKKQNKVLSEKLKEAHEKIKDLESVKEKTTSQEGYMY